VYRDFGACPDGTEGSGPARGCAVCEATDSVAVTPTTGCDTFALNNANNYARLPGSYAPDVEIDTGGYDSRWDSLTNPYTPLDPDCPVPPTSLEYPDLWSLTGNISGALQTDVLEDTCYCPGEGVESNSLSIGRPRFPSIDTIPFFSFGGGDGTTVVSGGETLTVREFNPDGPPLDTGCCPQPDDLPDHIEAEIVNGEIRLTRREKPEVRDVYRADDTDQSFQLVAGYPKSCCLKDDCGWSSSADEFVNRELHFPRWPSPNSLTTNIDINQDESVRTPRNPYESDEVSREEPLGIIPVVVDIQCYEDGRLYVYYANIVVHDGVISGLQWNVKPPRSESVVIPGNLPPLPPEDLDVNRDYQEQPVWATIVSGTPPTYLEDFTPIVAQDDPAPWCEETCDAAATAMGKAGDACSPACPTEALMCADYPGSTQFISVAYGATAEDAAQAALDQALNTDAPANCEDDPNTVDYFTCYTVFDEGAMAYEAAVAYCCTV